MIAWILLVEFFALVTAEWEHEIYVSSLDGLNTSSCWTGGIQTPCNTLDLALKGLQHNSSVIYLYSGTYVLKDAAEIIYKSDIAIIGGLDTGNTIITCEPNGGILFSLSTNITLSLITIQDCGNLVVTGSGLQNEHSTLLFRFHLSSCVNIRVSGVVIESESSVPISDECNTCDATCESNLAGNNDTCTKVCPTLMLGTNNDRNTAFSGEAVYVTASIRGCASEEYEWKNDLNACFVSSMASFSSLSYMQCTNLTFNSAMKSFPVLLYYNSTSPVLSKDSDVFEVILSVQTLGPLIQQLISNISLTLKPCVWPFTNGQNGKCVFAFHEQFCCSESNDINECVQCNDESLYIRQNHTTNCISRGSTGQFFSGHSPTFYDCGGCPSFLHNCSSSDENFNISDLSSVPFCGSGRTGRLCGACLAGKGVPINQLSNCVDCEDHSIGFLVFFLIQILPTTLMVLLMMVFSVNLTNGFLNGLVFYCQITSVVYPGLTFNMMDSYCGNFDNYSKEDCIYYKYYYINLPATIFNWNFIPFLFSYPLCISPNMTSLQALAFWYVIPSYPFLLLIVILAWIRMYNRGLRCVVEVSRPIHRLLARFWRMNDIEPSLLHSMASIYLLSFTQYVATSFQILHPTRWHLWNNTEESGIAFFYDGTLDYFSFPHGIYMAIAIFVLIFIVMLPMVFIQLYPFKFFHQLLSRFHLRKAIVISLGDVFTGPFKNSSDDSFEYRYFAGFYLLLRMVILALHFMPYNYGPAILFSQEAVFLAFGGMIMIFRPYRRNIHNFGDFFIIIFLAVMNILMLYIRTGFTQITILTFSLLAFSLTFLVYFFFPMIKKVRVCYLSYRRTHKQTIEEPSVEDYVNIVSYDKSEDDSDFFADRIENPDDYEEHHATFIPHEISTGIQAVRKPETSRKSKSDRQSNTHGTLLIPLVDTA